MRLEDASGFWRQNSRQGQQCEWTRLARAFSCCCVTWAACRRWVAAAARSWLLTFAASVAVMALGMHQVLLLCAPCSVYSMHVVLLLGMGSSKQIHCAAIADVQQHTLPHLQQSCLQGCNCCTNACSPAVTRMVCMIDSLTLCQGQQSAVEAILSQHHIMCMLHALGYF